MVHQIFFRTYFGYWISLGLLGMVGCTSKSTQLQQEPTSSTNIAALAQILQLKNKPTRVQWVKFTRNQFNNEWGILAVLEYPSQYLTDLKTKAKKLNYTFDHLDKKMLKPWYPKDLRSCFEQQSSSKHLRFNCPVYAATHFAKSPLLRGFMAFSGRFLWLYLYAQ